MKKIFGLMTAVLLVLGFGTSRLLAQAYNEDMAFSLGGTTTATTFDDAGNDLGAGIAGAAGVQSFNLGTVLSSGSGLGTITLTYDPGSNGTFFFDVATQEATGTAPSYNEFGSKSGSPGAGQSYEIGYIPVDPSTGQITGVNPQVYNDVANATGLGTLGNTNTLPVAGSNFLDTCLTEPGCNGYTAVDLGLSFVLTSTEEEIVTFNTSTSAPGSGFYVETTNPGGGTVPAANLYYTISGLEQAGGTPPPPPPPPATPEPSSWVLMLTGMGAVVTKVRSKLAA
jgi:hypothetical protein